MAKEMGSSSLVMALQDLGQFSTNEIYILSNHFKCITLLKDACLIKEGQTCQSIDFIEKGSFRHYFISETGEEVTQNLYTENDWLFEYKSFTSQKPSTSIIQATEDSSIHSLTVYDLHKLMKLSDSFFQLGRIFQFAMQQQGLQLQNTTPKERYLNLLSSKPQLIQHFPLKFIASYLGMTPETLSRVRRSIA